MAKENHFKRVLVNINRNKKPKLAEWADNQENATASILWLIENWVSNTKVTEDVFAYLARNYNSLSPSSDSSIQEGKDIGDASKSKSSTDASSDSDKKQEKKAEEINSATTTETPKIEMPSNMNYLHKSKE